MKLQVQKLKPAIDKLHKKYGDKNYCILYGTGCIKNPEVMFLFMNPTGRNLSVHKNWRGIRASWIGHKNTWQLFSDLGVFDSKLNGKLQVLGRDDWTPEFAEEIYENISDNRAYVSGLGRFTQPDARHVPDHAFRACRDITLEEIRLVNPKVIIAFGNQVSSNLLGEPIKVSEWRTKKYDLKIGKKSYAVYPTYYPVGMGLRNIGKAIQDINKILNKNRQLGKNKIK